MMSLKWFSIQRSNIELRMMRLNSCCSNIQSTWTTCSNIQKLLRSTN